MTNKHSVPVIASYLLTFAAAIIVLKAALLLALFSGLLVYSLVHLITPLVEKRIRFVRARIFVIAILSLVVISTLSMLILAAMAFARSDAGSVHMLLQNMAGIIEESRSQFPLWISDYLPSGSDALRDLMSDWMRQHGKDAQIWGEEAGHSIIQLLMGMIIGGMIALHETCGTLPEFAQALLERAINLQTAFQRILGNNLLHCLVVAHCSWRRYWFIWHCDTSSLKFHQRICNRIGMKARS